MTTATRGICSLLHAPPRQDHSQGTQKDRQVEPEGPVVQVGEIVPQLDFRFGRVLTGDLSETGQTRPHPLSQRPSGDAPGESTRELRALRPRSDETHVSPKDVHELWDLVDSRGAENPSDARHPRVAARRENGAGLDLRSPAHRS